MALMPDCKGPSRLVDDAETDTLLGLVYLQKGNVVDLNENDANQETVRSITEAGGK
tara:strand:- start:48 stop:215 length:168 start_codon:yes stop_codon:yes gene_type:complete